MTRGPAFCPHDEHLDQGDIFSSVPLGKWEDGKLIQGPGVRAVITSHGCACEDYERALEAGRTQAAAKIMLQVAPLRTIKGVPANRLEEIATGKHLDYFYVFGEANKLPDHLLDFTQEQPVPASVLTKCTKIARLSAWQWRRLLVHLAVSRFHQQPEKLFLPELLEQEAGAIDT